MKYYNISQFEFSQAHMFFWDKVRNFCTIFSKKVKNYNVFFVRIFPVFEVK